MIRPVILFISLCLLFLLPARGSAAVGPHTSTLQADFARAAAEFKVPLPVLLSVSYNLTRWESHGGSPSTSGGYGVMQLTHVDAIPSYTAKGDGIVRVQHDPALHTLDQASSLLHVSIAQLKHNTAQNIRGGAAMLARDAGKVQPSHLSGWYQAVARYSGFTDPEAARTFADTVFDTIRQGIARRTAEGQVVRLARHSVTQHHWITPLRKAKLPQPECPASMACTYVPAAYQVNNPSDPTDYGNYDAAHRNGNEPDIRYIVMHDTEGSYAAAINEFRDPTQYTSAHYVVRSVDGAVTQMVQTKNIAWHAGNYYLNMHSIGIEQEGVAIDGASWFTEAMYQQSAHLVRYLAKLYHIPLDRAHIIGHDQVPGPTASTVAGMHWDPGPYWDWGHFMDLLHAPLLPPGGMQTSGVITIAPDFATNQQVVTSCDNGSCQTMPPQGTSFVPLYTAPDLTSPLISDRALEPNGAPGTTEADEWGDKASVGEKFYEVDRQGEWDEIDFGGQEAWLYDPSIAPTTAADAGLLITPRKGLASIPVYGRAYPETSAYPAGIDPQPVTPLQYTIPAGQKYVITDQVKADYYYSPTMTKHALVHGLTSYFVISFNHRLAFVKASDVDVIAPLNR